MYMYTFSIVLGKHPWALVVLTRKIWDGCWHGGRLA